MALDLLRYADHLGPCKVVNIYNATTGLRAVLVIDNIATGPSIGGIRIAPDVTEEEAFRLARAMTLKNASAGLPHGGGKSVIQADPKKLSATEKESLIRSFALAIRDLTEYIPGPDMGTDESCMAWIKDEIGRAVGLPREIGGIPLDEIGATGRGLVASAKVACDKYKIPLKGARVVIQGFGAVGKFAASFLEKEGAIIVAAADSQGSIYNENGIDISNLIAAKNKGVSVVEYPDGERVGLLDIISIPCDIWIPAAQPDVIRMDNVNQLETKLILQGANIPITTDAEEILYKKGIHVIPDFIANAGGVICASVEYHGGSEHTALEVIQQKITLNTAAVIDQSVQKKMAPREAANQIAMERVLKAMTYQRT